MTGFFPILELKGNPYDIGLAHGRALAGEIKENLDLYYSMVRGLTGLKPDQCLGHATRYITTIKEDALVLLEEMEGIAHGAEVSLEEIMFLNARSEIMSMKPATGVRTSECTALGLTGERITTGQPVLAQNWDWHERVRGTSAIFTVKPTNGARALYFAEAGQVGKIGVNEFGVGVLLNILFTEEEVRYGLPVHVLLRLILNSRGTAEAVALVKGARRAGGSHFLVGDDTGHIVGLELTPTGIGEIEPENGILLHTNHYCIPDLVQKDIGLQLFADTTPRFDRAATLVSGRKQWDTQALSDIFTDHQDGPPSICRHANPLDPDYLRIVSIASCIIDLAQRKMLVSSGQPCRTTYREVVLE
jgi:isopenicillin-N N-acyltransferase-like protein